MKKIIASACCCGITCRWHGKKTYKSKTIKQAEADGFKVIPVCPEMLGGLPCPRPPVKTRKGRVFETDPDTRSTFGTERTYEFETGAEKALNIAKKNGAKKALFFKLSPSCALNGIAGKKLRSSGIEVVPIW